MKTFKRLYRFIHINIILARYNILEFALNDWFSPFRVFFSLNPLYWQNKKLSRGERVRRAFEDLGPIFVKAGQILSTRRDFIPDDIAIELAKLQDRVPPFSGNLAKLLIEEALQCSIEEAFLNFSTDAMASASIAQVHAATLKSGEAVVVKVLRPGILKIIEEDIDLLLIFAKLAERYLAQTRHFKPKQIVREIAQTLVDELDLMREGANASQLRRHAANTKLLYVPKVYWEYCRTTVLVTERVYGIPIHNVEALKQAGFDMKKLAENGLEIFFTQVFRDNFFHADLHPGNIFVDEKDKKNPTYLVVDFGIMGSLNHQDQRYLAENMVAFFKRDYQRVAELHIACGWIPPDTRIDQFEGAIRAVSEPVFEQALYKISFGNLLLRLFQVARRFDMNIQPQLILLQKTLLNIEGLSRQLSPELDIWESAYPKIEKWLKKQVGVKALLGRIRENLPLWSDQLPDMPGLIYEILKNKKGQLARHEFKQITKKDEDKKITASSKWRYAAYGALFTFLLMGSIYVIVFQKSLF